MVSLSHIILGCAKMKKSTFRTVIVLALLLAAEIVLSRFLSISLQNLKFGFSFLVVAFAAREFGFLGGAAVGGLGDLGFGGAVAIGETDHGANSQLIAHIFLGLLHKRSGDADGCGGVLHTVVADGLDVSPGSGLTQQGVVALGENVFQFHKYISFNHSVRGA